MFVRASVELLAWESQFFDRRLGRVVFNDTAPFLTPSTMVGFTLVQARVAAQATAQMDALSAIGFRLVEGEMDCCYNLSAYTAKTHIAGDEVLSAVEIRLAREADIPSLRTLVEQTLVQSRFREPWFKREERQRFYAQWVVNAVRGSFDNLCLVAQDPTDIFGLVTLRNIGGKIARIGLLTVSPAVRGCGIGKLLCRAALDWCRNRGFQQLWVSTQTANLPAMRLYLASGAQIVHSANWLYRGPNDSI